MDDIVVDGKAVAWPALCACCLARPETTVSASKPKTIHLGVARITRTLTEVIPYCAECSNHVAEHRVANPVGILGCSFLLFVAIAYPLFKALFWALDHFHPPPPASPAEVLRNVSIVAVLVALSVAPSVVFAWRQLSRKPTLLRMPPHSRGLPAVEIVDFSDSSVTLRLYNIEFASRLLKINKARRTTAG